MPATLAGPGEDHPHPPDDQRADSVSVVVPVYNEGGSVAELVNRLSASLKGGPYELIFVDDRSQDDTVAQLQRLAQQHPIRVLSKRGPRGKAQSLLQGIEGARHRYVALIDGDLQYPPEAIPAMLQRIEAGAADVVVARRRHREPLLRRLPSRVCRGLLRVAAKSLTVDVQSGLKVFSREAVTALPLTSTRWTFDFAFLLQCQRSGLRIKSHPVDFAPRTSGRSKVHVLPATLEILSDLLLTTIRTPALVAFGERDRSRRGRGYYYRGVPYVTHSGLDLGQSAVRRFSRGQLGLLALMAAAVATGILLDRRLALLGVISLTIILYFTDFLFSLLLICRSYGQQKASRTRERSPRHRESWPRYTVLCPLYREAAILSQFVAAMAAMEYPKDRLEVMLLLEEDDAETQAEVQRLGLPEYFQVRLVPDSRPKTKPKACNFGLTHATGEYAVIYDAEDVPDPDQLKKAIRAFESAGPEVACVQAKLNYYNWNQGLLTRLFTLEYSLWFNLILPGLQSLGAPIPLGGTSNHFRVCDLRAFGGWDPFNVTEDADLGIRLCKAGYTTLIMDSTTLEEANSRYGNWIRQRSRWMKGYIQTFWVHNRSGNRLDRRRNHLMFELVIGGRVFAALVNPVLWLLTIAYILDWGHLSRFIQSLLLAPVYYMGLAAFVLGNFLYIYYYMLGAARRRHYELILNAWLAPLYWALISIAAYKALLEFALRPFHWQKTTHGLHLAGRDGALFISDRMASAASAIGPRPQDEAALIPLAARGIEAESIAE
ncbi:MAG: glycosyltransferase family 2 protein [Candidatus Dormibacteria bacterium]